MAKSIEYGSQYYPSYVQHPGYEPPVQYQSVKVVKPSSVTWSWDPKDDLSLPAMEYEVVKVPVGTPYVDRGAHRMRVPGIGCTMELVSALAGEVWTDYPGTAHPGLTRLMIKMNDRLPDGARQKMLKFVPRLLDTNTPIDWELESMIHNGFRQAYSMWPLREDDHQDIRHLLHMGEIVLDEFDKRLGRPTRKMDNRTLTRLMTALAA